MLVTYSSGDHGHTEKKNRTYALNGRLLLLCHVNMVSTWWRSTFLALTALVQQLQESGLVLVDKLYAS